MRERERKERGEILNEDGKEIRWMEEEGDDRKRKGRGIGRKKYIHFWNCIFMFVIRNPKARRSEGQIMHGYSRMNYIKMQKIKIIFVMVEVENDVINYFE
jgi:hypothetical protein